VAAADPVAAAETCLLLPVQSLDGSNFYCPFMYFVLSLLVISISVDLAPGL
jgi:hypothetical protein